MNRSEEVRDFYERMPIRPRSRLRTHTATSARTPDPRRAEFHLIWPAILSLGDQT